MRLTKKLKKDIELEVWAKYRGMIPASEKIAELERPFIKALAKEAEIYTEKIVELRNEFEEKAREIASKQGYKFNGEDDLIMLVNPYSFSGLSIGNNLFFGLNSRVFCDPWSYNIDNGSILYSEDVLDCCRNSEALDKQYESDVRNIILELELGPKGKEKLDKMIEAVNVTPFSEE